MNNRKGKAVKARARRRNPIARALRDALFRARRQASKRRYSRKRKHPSEAEHDES
jgi:hypothetical protein